MGPARSQGSGRLPAGLEGGTPAGAGRRPVREWLWLLPPVALGAFLRLFRLGPQLLLSDELHAPRAVGNLDLAEILTSYLPADNSIPLTALYEVLAGHGVALTEWHLRLPSMVAGLLALVVVPVALARRLGREAGPWAAWLVAISPGLIFYSRHARPYMPAALLVFVAAMAFVRWWRTGSRRSAAGYAVAAAGAVWLHLVSLPIAAAPLLWAAGAKAARAISSAGRHGGEAGSIAREADRPRAGRSVGGILVVGLGFAACCALFLFPARESLLAMLADKSGSDRPRPATLGEVLFLQAGAAEPFAALLFWAIAVFGLAVLFRRRPGFAGLTLTLVGTQAVAVLVSAPVGVPSPTILFRYLLVGLPFVLAWAAAGLAAAWRAAGESAGAWRWTGRAAAAAAVVLLVLGGPLDDRRLLHSSFLTHDDFLEFSEPVPRMVSPGLVPQLYRRLAADPGGGAVIEASALPTWAWQTHLRIYQDVHRRRVLLAPPEPKLFRDEFAFANYVEPQLEALLAAPAAWLVLHRNSPRELERVDVGGTVGLPLAKAIRSHARQTSRGLRRVLEQRWGPPDYADEFLLAWDLERVRRSTGGGAGGREPRAGTEGR